MGESLVLEKVLFGFNYVRLRLSEGNLMAFELGL